MWIKILCIEYILWGIPTIESKFDVANMVKTATVKDVPIINDALLANCQAILFIICGQHQFQSQVMNSAKKHEIYQIY